MILVKQYNSHQIAHLYEHLFYTSIDNFFYDNELFPYIDYEVNAHTLHGLIYVDIQLLTDEAKQLSNELPNIKIADDRKNIHIGFIQLASELKSQLGIEGEDSADWDAVHSELHLIDNLPWKNIDEVDVVNITDTELVKGSIYTLEESRDLALKTIDVTFKLKPALAEKYNELIPLFIELAASMSENTYTELSAELGCYSDNVNFKPKHKATELTHIFRISDAIVFDMNELRETIVDSVTNLIDSGALMRYTQLLGNLSTKTNHEDVFPQPYRLFKCTGLIVGLEGWKRIATEHNYKKIISNMEIVISVDDTTIRIENLFED